MKIYDISVTIHEQMAVYKNKEEKVPQFERTRDHETSTVQETKVHLDVHTGTHIDAKLHVFPGGDTIGAHPLEQLVRPCKVLDFTDVEDGITKADLEKKSIQSGDFVLLKTKNTWDDSFNFKFIYLKEDGAKYLADIGVQGVGIDALGVERDQPGHPTHKTLMNADIIIVEGLQFREVDEGDYFMVAAPLKLQELDGAPARVLLLQNLPHM